MFINFRVKTQLLSLYRKSSTFYEVSSTLDAISTACVCHYGGVSCLVNMRFGSDLLADVISRQSFQTELPESSPKATAPRVTMKRDPLRTNNVVACFWCLAFYNKCGLVLLNRLQKQDLKEVVSYSILCSWTV